MTQRLDEPKLEIGMKSGQILIIVLLIVVVALAVGLSIASRNLTNIRTSTQTQESQRAFTAAEGGVEDVLAKFSKVVTDITAVAQGGPTGVNPNSQCNIPNATLAKCQVTVNNITFDVNVTPSPIYKARINTGQVAQLNLKDAQLNGVTSVKISWSERGTPEVQNPRAAIEVVFVCSALPCVGNTTTAAPSGYAQDRHAFTLNSPAESGFTSCPGTSGVATAVSPGDTNYDCTITFPLPSPPNNNVLLVRIRPFHQNTAVVPGTTVGGSSGTANPLPVQQYDVTSLATTPDTGIARKVKVTRTTLPILPAAFDFALYSEGAIAK